MRRIIDVVTSAVAIVLLGPVIIAVALAIWCHSGTPVLFTQQRIGQGGKPFTILRFRTMRAALYAGEPNSERLTPLGRFLRTSSLDTVPRLWNVLRGQMSLLGPLPEAPETLASYSLRQHGRLTVRPGLTSFAQLFDRNCVTWDEAIELDLWYINHRSLLLDLRILFHAVRRPLRRPRTARAVR